MQLLEVRLGGRQLLPRARQLLGRGRLRSGGLVLCRRSLLLRHNHVPRCRGSHLLRCRILRGFLRHLGCRRRQALLRRLELSSGDGQLRTRRLELLRGCGQRGLIALQLCILLCQCGVRDTRSILLRSSFRLCLGRSLRRFQLLLGIPRIRRTILLRSRCLLLRSRSLLLRCHCLLLGLRGSFGLCLGVSLCRFYLCLGSLESSLRNLKLLLGFLRFSQRLLCRVELLRHLGERFFRALHLCSRHCQLGLRTLLLGTRLLIRDTRLLLRHCGTRSILLRSRCLLLCSRSLLLRCRCLLLSLRGSFGLCLGGSLCRFHLCLGSLESLLRSLKLLLGFLRFSQRLLCRVEILRNLGQGFFRALELCRLHSKFRLRTLL